MPPPPPPPIHTDWCKSTNYYITWVKVKQNCQNWKQIMIVSHNTFTAWRDSVFVYLPRGCFFNINFSNLYQMLSGIIWFCQCPAHSWPRHQKSLHILLFHGLKMWFWYFCQFSDLPNPVGTLGGQPMRIQDQTLLLYFPNTSAISVSLFGQIYLQLDNNQIWIGFSCLTFIKKLENTSQRISLQNKPGKYLKGLSLSFGDACSPYYQWPATLSWPCQQSLLSKCTFRQTSIMKQHRGWGWGLCRCSRHFEHVTDLTTHNMIYGTTYYYSTLAWSVIISTNNIHSHQRKGHVLERDENI